MNLSFRTIHLTLALLYSLTCVSEGHEFALSGRLAERSTTGDTIFGFKAKVKDCNWSIEIMPPDDIPEDKIFAFDGSYFYTVSGTSLFTTQSTNHIYASVSPPTLVFPEVRPLVTVVWTALAQACYLDTLTNNLAICAFDPPADYGPIPVTLSRHSSPPRLPMQISYHNSGTNQATGMRYPRPYDRGYRSAEYQVLAVTNVSEMTIPTHFRLTLFMPKANALNSNDLAIATSYEGVIDGVISSVAPGSFVPDIPKRSGVIITDHRFQFNDQPFTYGSDSGWRSAAEVKTSPEFKQWTQDNLNAPKQSNRTYLFYLSLAAGATLLFVWLGFRMNSTSLQNTDTA